MGKTIKQRIWSEEGIYLYSSMSQKKGKPINQVNFSENYNDLSPKVYITKFCARNVPQN